jgi:hypothetical protein
MPKPEAVPTSQQGFLEALQSFLLPKEEVYKLLMTPQPKERLTLAND